MWKSLPKFEKYIHATARLLLLVFTLVWFLFALLSGADGSIISIIHNSPNALPWFILLILNFVAWKWERTGGMLVVLFGLWTIIQYNALESVFIFATISIPIIILGLGLMANRYLPDN